MRRLATALLALALVAGVGLLGAASDDGAGGKRTYRIVFDNAFGLVEGGDFRVAAVRAGQTTKFGVETSPDGPPKAVATVEVTQPGIAEFRADATCAVKPQSLVGEYYVDCQPGSSRRPLGNGGTVPVEQTESTIPPDLVNDMLRRPYRERVRVLVAGLGTGLAGRVEDLQGVLRRAHPGLRETSKVLRVLGRENRTIERFLADADRVVGALARDRRDVSRFVRESGRTAETAAGRREALRESVRRLPAFLRELRPSMARLGELSSESVPLLADLERAGPDLNRVLRDLRPFAAATRPALRELGVAAVPATQALREGRQEVAGLRALSRDARPVARPLRQLLQSLDDRRRAIEDDPRAAEGGPPAPDPTHISGRGGFTGFEALANYFFWQALSINAFDDVGHLLTVSAVVNKCSPFVNDPRQSGILRDCNSWLGPRQPGINAPDPSTVSAPGSSNRARVRRERRARAPQPSAPPAADPALDFLLGP